ncbi:hypothetical protein [Streptomyces sp. NPDC057302]
MSARDDIAACAWLTTLNALDKARLAAVNALLALVRRINREGGA